MENEGVNVGYLESPTTAFIFLAAMRSKWISFERKAYSAECKITDGNNLLYNVTVPKCYDFLEAIKFPMKVTSLQIYNGGDLLYAFDSVKGISRIDFSTPIPVGSNTMALRYELDSSQFYGDAVCLDEQCGSIAFPIFVMRISQPSDRFTANDVKIVCTATY